MSEGDERKDRMGEGRMEWGGGRIEEEDEGGRRDMQEGGRIFFKDCSIFKILPICVSRKLCMCICYFP